MFERFTDQSRRVVVLAQEEARLLHHNYIGTEHILLGLVRDVHDNEASAVLHEFGVGEDAIRAQMEEIVEPGSSKAITGHIPFTPRAKKVLELSLKEALSVGDNHIGTEHILLGLFREGDGVAYQVLVRLDLNLDSVRQAIIRRHAARGPDTPAEGRSRVTVGPRTFGGIEARLDRIERRLGIEPSSRSLELRQLDDQIASVGRDKEAAIEAQDFERSMRLRSEEMRLIKKWYDMEQEQPEQASVTPLLEELTAARTEIARLTELLRQHDIDPNV